jgi:hypothetical protein
MKVKKYFGLAVCVVMAVFFIITSITANVYFTPEEVESYVVFGLEDPNAGHIQNVKRGIFSSRVFITFWRPC